MVLQETKQLGSEIVKVGKSTLFKSGGKTRYLGMGFIVSERISCVITDFQAISERLCYLTLRGKYRKISNAHAPIEEKDMEIKNKFYEQFGEPIEKVPKYDIKIIVEDMNVKVGSEDIYRNIIGSKSLHKESNGNGKKS
ncbi:uncharacterized protein [Diabrotica undecimpunctata]|uniref:uncharacterized protein n=1 Tax=Diabrotica undecimpunctata TaxID=50387 RepID=UPI003B6411BD